MGCGWTAPNTDFSRVTAIEIINGDLRTVRLRHVLLAGTAEQRVPAYGLGGSDNHDSDLPSNARSAVGRPTTVIYAQALSEQSILDAIREGHVFIDVEGTKDRIVEFEAKTDGSIAAMGDSLKAPAGHQIQFSVRMIALQGAFPEIVQDGQRTFCWTNRHEPSQTRLEGLTMSAMAKGTGLE